MNDSRFRKRRYNALISAWASFAFVFFFFYIIGDLLVGWWHNAWWVWMIIGFSLIGAVSSTLRYVAYGFSSVPQEAEVRHYSTDLDTSDYIIESDPTHKPQVPTPNASNNAKFCKFCGEAKEENSQYCSNCGLEIDD